VIPTLDQVAEYDDIHGFDPMMIEARLEGIGDVSVLTVAGDGDQ